MGDKKKWLNGSRTPTYYSWSSMRNRVLSSSHKNNARYKLFTICPQWVDDYDRFFKDMGERPFGTTLDRIDNDGGYTPENCRWASHRVQQNNKKSLHLIEHNGVLKTLGEWAFELDLTQRELNTAYSRRCSAKATTYEELFCKRLKAYRVSIRVNKCLVCDSINTQIWHKQGKLCNNCYQKATYWAKKNTQNINNFPAWECLFGDNKQS